MKKLLFVLLDILAIGFLIGGYIIQYFAKRKLGMIRWLNFRNRKIEEELPVDMLKYAAVIIVVILTVFILVMYGRKWEKLCMADRILAGAMVILVVVYVGFTVVASTSVTGSYYFTMPLMGAAALMLAVRNLIAIMTMKK